MIASRTRLLCDTNHSSNSIGPALGSSLLKLGLAGGGGRSRAFSHESEPRDMCLRPF